MKVLCKTNENYPELELGSSYEAISIVLKDHPILDNSFVDCYKLPEVSENTLYPSWLFFSKEEARDFLINKIVE
jgi:hypothetical protein